MAEITQAELIKEQQEQDMKKNCNDAITEMKRAADEWIIQRTRNKIEEEKDLDDLLVADYILVSEVSFLSG